MRLPLPRITFASLLVAGLLVLPATPAAARTAVVTLDDGRQLQGELVRQDDAEVVLEIAGIERTLDRDGIASMTVGEDAADIYRQKKADLPAGDADAWYALILYLYGQEQYPLAQQETAALLAKHPDHEPGQRLKTVLDAQLALEQKAQPTQGQAQGQGQGQSQTPDTPGPQDEEDAPQDALLTDEQINLIRLWELPADLSKAKPRIRVPREVVNVLLTDYAGQADIPDDPRKHTAYRRKPAHEQLASIFKVRARELYPQVQVLQDPQSLELFRMRINPSYVVRYFDRHFGDGAVPGLDLNLLTRRPNAARHAYTNFYRLSQATYDGKPLIDRNNPERSLLIQWGLPRDEAMHPAPDVRGWRPLFTGLTDPTYRQYRDWIDSLFAPAPDYGIEPAEADTDGEGRATPAGPAP